MLDQTAKGQSDSDNDNEAAPPPEPDRRRGLSLTWRLLTLTVVFLMATAILIYVPTIANFRVSWLADRMTMADAASSVLVRSVAADVPREIQDELLAAVGAIAIAIRDGSVSRLIATVETPPDVDRVADLRSMDLLREIYDAFATLAAANPRTLRVIGESRSGALLEILIDDRALRMAMVEFSVNVLRLSALLSLITAALLYLAINRLLVRPMRRISRNMVEFSEAPEDHDRVIIPSGRADEVGIAEERLAAMQRELQETLRQQRHLADLGLAVSKINHDLRNMLASAQLFSDRIGSLPDPAVQRFAPKLIGALDRAISYCQTTLAYGRAREDAPTRRLLRLKRLIDDVAEVLGLVEHPTINWENAVAEELEIDADPDQMFRVLVNLGRNAIQALESDPGPAVVRRLTMSADRQDARVTILVRDTGPGVPERARAKLFQAFHGSVRPGGTGLGLAIAAEIVGAHGGSITLVDPDQPGATFAMIIPDRRSHGRDGKGG